MKVGLVCPYDILRGGGVQECVLAIQKELVSRGHSAKIIAPTSPKHAAGNKNPNVIFVGSATTIKSPFHTSAEVSASASIESLTKMLDNERFDILHFHEPWVPVLSRQLLARSDSINIATFHAKLPETAMSKTIERVITPYTRSALKYLDGLTAVSDAAAEYVRSLTKQPVVIIPNGIDLRKYSNNKPAADPAKQTILYVGRLEKRKGVKYLLRAFARLQQSYPNVTLIIAGDGPGRQKLEDLAASLRLKNIKFLGFVNEKQKLGLFKSASVFTSPALFGESFGIVLLEAMATGTVVVAGNNPGYVGLLTGRGSLSLINPKDISLYTHKLEIMLTDGVIRRLWQDWAAKQIVKYDYSRVVKMYEDFYKQTTKQADRSRL